MKHRPILIPIDNNNGNNNSNNNNNDKIIMVHNSSNMIERFKFLVWSQVFGVQLSRYAWLVNDYDDHIF